MPPKKRVTDIGIVGSSAPVTRRQYAHISRVATVKQVKRTSIDEITDLEGDNKLDTKSRIAVHNFLKNAETAELNVSNYIEERYSINRDERSKIGSLLDVEEGVKVDRKRFLNNLTLILRDVPNGEDGYGLTDVDKNKIAQLLTFNESQDLELELGYLLRHKEYGIDIVLDLIQDPYLTIDRLPHLKESKRMLKEQMELANNPMEGVELLECKACKNKTYITGLVTTRAWDEMQTTRGSCYNTACRLYKG